MITGSKVPSRSIHSVDLELRFEGTYGEHEAVLSGRNDFPILNPILPHRLLDGDAATWFIKTSTVPLVSTKVQDNPIVAIQAGVDLGTGETVETGIYDWSAIPRASFE